ncbi:hypothetical protein PV08_02041 [Exophiala spinifera]|uniref:N-acetyltransferase domain-containing protein n=1 Tax=Exophiala spinifera TaxID=91928 RepID=A0A0D1Z1E6_9EURO|nr:uncharacterized protein PV08_02041 [Exophiala spinifera]KIW21461.1 hypothetical protein PV08_02041 [Exophiala spinifera]
MDQKLNLSSFRLRPATAADRPALDALFTSAITQLCRNDYSPLQVSTMVSQATAGRYDLLISKSTYYVVHPADDPSHLVASGGWWPQRTIYTDEGSETAQYEKFDPRETPAWIRGIYVHPDYVRRGLGFRIVQECEAAASRFMPFTTYMLGSTVNAIPLYKACGYRVIEEHDVSVTDGEMMKIAMMEKTKGATTVALDDFNRDVVLVEVDIR